MSLEALNQPPLVAGAGALALAALPVLENAIQVGTIPFPVVLTLNGLSYGLNVYATSQPGRIDGQQQLDKMKSRKGSSSEEPEEMEAFTPGDRGRTLVAPQGWAFAIWAPIFAGELLFCSSAAFVRESSPVATVIKKASGGFIMSQVFQTLWTAAFRPKYKGKLAYVSASLLSAIAYSLNRAHVAFTTDRLSYSFGEYMLYFLPMSLHFGWTTAASLVNINGSLAMSPDASSKAIAWLGHASVLSATALGVFISITRQAPVFSGVIAWALAACAGGMEQRLQETDKQNPQQAGVYGARLQKWLCRIGALVSAAASVTVVVLANKKKSS